LALGAEITAPASHDRAADLRSTAITRLSLAVIGAMVALIFSRLAFGVKKIGNGRAAQDDGFAQDFLQHAAQRGGLFLVKFGAEASWMNFGAPKAFVGVDVADTAEEALVKEQGFDSGTARAQALREILEFDFEGISAKGAKFVGERIFRKIGDAAETPRIGVAQLAAVVEKQNDVSVFFGRFGGGIWREIAGHAEMDEE